MKLVVKEQFPQDLVLAFCGMDLLSQLVGIFVDLAVLRPLVYRLPAMIVHRLQLFPLSSLPLSLLFDAVLVCPFRFWFLEGKQFFWGSLLIPRFGEYAPEGEEVLNFLGGDCSAADPVFDPGDVEHDLSLKGYSLSR